MSRWARCRGRCGQVVRVGRDNLVLDHHLALGTRLVLCDGSRRLPYAGIETVPVAGERL